MVSLNFDDMDNCKISNQNKILKNKSQKLSQIFDPSQNAVNEIIIVRKNEL